MESPAGMGYNRTIKDGKGEMTGGGKYRQRAAGSGPHSPGGAGAAAVPG